MGLFVGAAMRRSGARADPRAVAATFEEMLGRR
jgi:Asp-tRNA(Asn)/Glu-tRNA(Gln) amidotransferase B subunit